jgi:hypothetical protein
MFLAYFFYRDVLCPFCYYMYIYLCVATSFPLSWMYSVYILLSRRLCAILSVFPVFWIVTSVLFAYEADT